METIEFNEVIKQNIEVVGGLIGLATSEKNGLMDKDKVTNNISLSSVAGLSALIAEVDGYVNFDIVFNHSYRKGSLYRLIIGSEVNKITATTSVLAGNEQCDFYYRKSQNGRYEIYAKNKIQDSMMLTINNFSNNYSNIYFKMEYKEIPSDAVKIEV